MLTVESHLVLQLSSIAYLSLSFCVLLLFLVNFLFLNFLLFSMISPRPVLFVVVNLTSGFESVQLKITAYYLFIKNFLNTIF